MYCSSDWCYCSIVPSPRNSRESHENYLIFVSTPIDPKFCGQAPKVAKMLLHKNHSLTCLATPEIEGSWFETKKRTPKMKTVRSKCSSRFSSNPSVKIFLGSHSTSRNKQFAKRSTSERDRTTGREGKTQEHKEQNVNHKEHIINRIPEDTRRLGPLFPLQSLVLTQIHQFVDLSHKKP
jgi:hypothetical protein